MQRRVQVFVVPNAPPSAPPVPADEVVVEAATIDGLRAAVHERLARDRYRVRAVSFAKVGMVAYVEERP